MALAASLLWEKDKIAGIVSERAADVGNDGAPMPVVETDRLIGLTSIGDLVKMQIADVEMEATATREYAGYGATFLRNSLDSVRRRMSASSSTTEGISS
jgi:hypothetical protein